MNCWTAQASPASIASKMLGKLSEEVGEQFEMSSGGSSARNIDTSTISDIAYRLIVKYRIYGLIYVYSFVHYLIYSVKIFVFIKSSTCEIYDPLLAEVSHSFLCVCVPYKDETKTCMNCMNAHCGPIHRDICYHIIILHSCKVLQNNCLTDFCGNIFIYL